MLETPVGYTPLLVALDLVRAKLAPAADAERRIAEACHSGDLAAAYRTWDGGAEELDPRVWLRVPWRQFFERGTVDLELPLLDDRGRPVQDGRTVQGCTREIFVVSASLAEFLATLPASSPNDISRPKRGPKAGKFERVVAEMSRDLRSGNITVEALRAQSEKEIAARYGVSRDTARKARTEATTGTESKPDRN